ncbi:MAG: hypothetical protein JRN62_05980 [Nitrososphaerota archaeon]|nr:hypothetical protein [Nitrososphaerota archaeon]
MSSLSGNTPQEEKFLDPKSYEDLSLRMKVNFFVLGNRGSLGFLGLFILVTVFNLLTGEAPSEVVTIVFIILSVITQVIIPQSIAEQAKGLTNHGIPLPSSINELSSTFSKVTVPLAAVSAAFFAILGYAWVAPAGSQVAQIKPLAAVGASAFLVLVIWSYSWSRFLEKIQEERYGSLHSGADVFFPMAVVSIVTSGISILSGVAHWEDSVAFYGPAIILSVMVASAIPGEKRISPRFARSEVLRLTAARSRLDARLNWLGKQTDRYQKDEHEAMLRKVSGEISQIDRKKSKYASALEDYGRAVERTISEIRSYLSRRLKRKQGLKSRAESGTALHRELVSAMDQSVREVAFPFEEELKSFLLQPEFDTVRQTVTVLDFPLILQSLGMYTPGVSKAELEPLEQQLNKSTFEVYGPLLLQANIKKYEKDEVAWLWDSTKSEASAREVYFWLAGYRNTIDGFVGEIRKRIDMFEKILALDPESSYKQLITSVRNDKRGLASARSKWEEEREAVRGALSQLERFRREFS